MRKQEILKTWTIALALAWGGLFTAAQEAQAIPTGQVHAQLATESFERLRAQWDAAFSQRRELDGSLHTLEATYLKLTERIAALKAKGTAASRPELERLLRQAKALAEDLQSQQSRVQRLDKRLQGIGKALVKELDTERIGLERELVLTRDSGIRASIIMNLNAISAQRASYIRHAQPRESLAVGDILQDAQALEDPNDMLAMADELQDAEAQVQKKLSQVESGLKELRARQRLLRHAERFSREENFFEEGDRARVYATRRVQASASQGSPVQQPDRQEAAPVKNGGDLANAPVQGAPPQSGSPTLGVQTPGGGARGGDPQPGVDGFNADTPAEAPLTDAPSQPPVAQPGPVREQGAGDPFAGGNQIIVVDEQADPNVSTAMAQRLDASSVDQKIKSLETSRSKLKKQVKELKRRAKKLRKRAASAD